jgi:predicted nuclease with TOPRIM domain
MYSALNIQIPISIEKELNYLISASQDKLNSLKDDYKSIQDYEKSLFADNNEPIENILTKLKEYEKLKTRFNSLNDVKVIGDYIQTIYNKKDYKSILTLEKLVNIF